MSLEIPIPVLSVLLFLCSRSDAFENPVLQQHYRNLEALALDLMAPEHIEDLTSKMNTHTPYAPDWPTSFFFSSAQARFFSSILSVQSLLIFLLLPLSVPNVNMMDQRLGSLAQEFRDLVYPADYNPEGKTAPKRKPGEFCMNYIVVYGLLALCPVGEILVWPMG